MVPPVVRPTLPCPFCRYARSPTPGCIYTHTFRAVLVLCHLPHTFVCRQPVFPWFLVPAGSYLRTFRAAYTPHLVGFTVYRFVVHFLVDYRYRSAVSHNPIRRAAACSKQNPPPATPARDAETVLELHPVM